MYSTTIAKIRIYLYNKCVDLKKAIKNVGIIGAITYIGGSLLLGKTLILFDGKDPKSYFIATIGLLLVITSGVLYIEKMKIKERVIHGAFTTLESVYHRLAEKTSGAEVEKTKIIAAAVDKLPDKIKEVMEKSPLDDI